MSDGVTVRLHAPARGSLNRHAEVDLATGPVFVKLYADPAMGRVERAVLDALPYDWRVPVVGSGDGWNAFPLLELVPATRDEATLRTWGERLRDVHACPPPEGLARMPRAVDDVPARIERLRAFDAEAARVAERVWTAGSAIRGDAEAYDARPTLLHDDNAWRNVLVRPDGVVTLVDFERAETGDPHWDLGKVWDADLAEPAARQAFLDGYGAEDWPHVPTLWATRLAAATAAVAFAVKVGDAEFATWGRALLDVLGDET